MNDTPIDSAPESVATLQPAAPPPNGSAGETQGSAPASVDTTVPGQEEPKGEEPERQSRREARAFASLRRQNAELQRELGRREGREEAARTSAPAGDQPGNGNGQSSEVEQLRREFTQREAERVGRSFWSSAEKEAKEKGIEGFEDAREALRTGEIPTNPVMSHYVTEMSDNKAALVVWLADNPDEAERIAGLDPVSAGVALAKADARLSARPSPRKTTTAPPPVPTVGGRSTPSFDEGRASMEEAADHWHAARAKKA